MKTQHEDCIQPSLPTEAPASSVWHRARIPTTGTCSAYRTACGACSQTGWAGSIRGGEGLCGVGAPGPCLEGSRLPDHDVGAPGAALQEYVLFLSADEAEFLTEPTLRTIAREPRWDHQRACLERLIRGDSARYRHFFGRL